MLLDYAAIIARAHAIRSRCGFLGKDPPYSTQVIHRTCFPDVHITGAKLPRGLLSMAEVGVGRRCIYYNRGAEQTAKRVGIVHEFYHLLTDLSEPVASEIRECNLGLRFLEETGAMPRSPHETGCDLFVGEVLAPHDVLHGYAPDVLFPKEPAALQVFEDECDRLASRFGVTLPFMMWHLRNLFLLRRSNFFIPG